MCLSLRTYYTLVLRDDGDGQWRAEFGDYSRATVQAKMEDYTQHAYLKKNAKIISSGDAQHDIEAAVAVLNV